MLLSTFPVTPDNLRQYHAQWIELILAAKGSAEFMAHDWANETEDDLCHVVHY